MKQTRLPQFWQVCKRWTCVVYPIIAHFLLHNQQDLLRTLVQLIQGMYRHYTCCFLFFLAVLFPLFLHVLVCTYIYIHLHGAVKCYQGVLISECPGSAVPLTLLCCTILYYLQRDIGWCMSWPLLPQACSHWIRVTLTWLHLLRWI